MARHVLCGCWRTSDLFLASSCFSRLSSVMAEAEKLCPTSRKVGSPPCTAVAARCKLVRSPAGSKKSIFAPRVLLPHRQQRLEPAHCDRGCVGDKPGRDCSGALHIE